jgi:uncharacterized protein
MNTLNNLAEYIIYDLLSIKEGSQLTDALLYFIPGLILLFILLVTVIYTMNIVTRYLSFERLRIYLEKNKNTGTGNILASCLGAVTPFCSCSSVPIFIGMMQAKIPSGIALSFLITSPLVNELALVVFWLSYGWKVTLLYVITGIVIGVLGGILLEKIGVAEAVTDWVKDLRQKEPANNLEKRSLVKLIPEIHHESLATIKKLTPFVLIGILIGSFIHGFVPELFFTETISTDNPFGVPIAVILAIPLYIDAVTILPVIDSLVNKGVPLGTAIAFMMGSIGFSLPSAILLKKVMKTELIAGFFVTIGVGMILSGYFFNLIF